MNEDKQLAICSNLYLIMLQSNDTQQQQLCPIKLFPEVDDACEAARTQSIDPLLSLTGVMH